MKATIFKKNNLERNFMKKAFEVVLNQGKKSLITVICLGALVLVGCKKDKSTPNPDDNDGGGNETPEDTTMVYVKANDANIRYTGRIDFSNPLAPQFSFPGVSIKTKFSGSAVDVVIKDFGAGGTTTTNYFNIIIDGNVHKVLKVNSTDTLYCVARGLASGEHTIEVFKRTEANVGKSSFKGFRVRINTSLSDPGVSTRKIEFIGDSFTCGYGNDKSFTTGVASQTGFHSEFENNYSAWGAIVSREFSAQYHCTAYSGRGMYRNIDGSTSGTAPVFYNRIHPDAAAPTWTASNYIPDLVVIHLGTNDLAKEAATPSVALDSTNFVDTYISMVSTIRTNYANAYIICVVPNSITDGYPMGLKQLTRMKNYTQAVVTHFNNATDNKVKYFLLSTQGPPYGEDWHPSNPTHTSMANQIKPFIQSTMGW